MKAQTEKADSNKSKAVARAATGEQKKEESGDQFDDKRVEVVSQRKLAGLADASPQAGRVAQMQAMADGVNGRTLQREAILEDEENGTAQAKFGTAQRVTVDEEDSSVAQKKDAQSQNNTGLPDTLKSGIENLSGFSMDDVKVHYNSAKPAQLQAHAFAQGTDIHMAPGQENHLPHEAWHVVQQKQGRVKPTRQMKGKVGVNGDAGLEREADVMGARASQLKSQVNGSSASEREDTGNRAQKRISDCDRTVAQRQPTTETVVQRAEGEEAEAEASKGWLSRIWTGFKNHGTWMMLVAEAIGHLVVTVAQSGLAAAGALWNIVSAVCQFFIGGGKMFRAYLVRRYAKDPNPKNQLENTSFNKIIASEGALGVISAVFSGLANIADLGKAASYVPKIGSIAASVIKTVRGAIPKGPKWLRGLITALEGIGGLVGNISNAVENSSEVFDKMGKVVAFGASKFVGAVKTVRGLKGMFEGKKGKGDTAGSAKEQIAGLRVMLQDDEVSEDTKNAISAEISRLGVKLPGSSEAAAEGRKRKERDISFAHLP